MYINICVLLFALVYVAYAANDYSLSVFEEEIMFARSNEYYIMPVLKSQCITRHNIFSSKDYYYVQDSNKLPCVLAPPKKPVVQLNDAYKCNIQAVTHCLYLLLHYEK